MHHANNAVVMQTKQLGRIKTLKEKLLALEGQNQQLEHKLEEQDHIITNLVGDSLKHLQDNMRLIAHINSLSKWMTQLEHQLGQVGSVLMGMIEGVIEREGTDLSEAKTSDASGNDQDNQGGDRSHQHLLVADWCGWYQSVPLHGQCPDDGKSNCRSDYLDSTDLT